MTQPIQTGTQEMPDQNEQEQALPTGRSLGLTIRNAAQLPADLWPDERISAIRAYVGKHAKTIGELAAFLATCQRYGLDPMVGQLFLIPSSGGPRVTTGRDTWLTLARREPNYDGILFGTIHEKDEFGHQRTENGRITVHHVVSGVQRGPLIGAYALVRDSKLGQNIEVRELKDFNHLLGKDNWKNYKADMIQNRCIAAVLRKEYGFPGLLITGEEDEITPDANAPVPLPNTGKGTAGLKADLGARVRAAQVERTEEAQDVVIETAEEAARPLSESAAADAARNSAREEEEQTELDQEAKNVPPVVELTDEQRAARAQELKDEARETYQNLMFKRQSKEKLTSDEQTTLNRIRKNYPEFMTETA